MDVLITQEQIARRVADLGNELADFYRGKPLTVVALLNGALPFAADLMRSIDLPLQYDTFAASSYINKSSTGELKVRSSLKVSVRDRHILVVDDVLDTGFTLQCIIRDFSQLGALSVKSCVLLNKKVEKKHFTEPDWVGFDVGNKFVVGYGLDYNEEYRNLPYIGVLQ